MSNPPFFRLGVPSTPNLYFGILVIPGSKECAGHHKPAYNEFAPPAESYSFACRVNPMNPLVDFVEHRLVWRQSIVLVGWIAELLVFVSLVSFLLYRILHLH